MGRYYGKALVVTVDDGSEDGQEWELIYEHSDPETLPDFVEACRFVKGATSFPSKLAERLSLEEFGVRFNVPEMTWSEWKEEAYEQILEEQAEAAEYEACIGDDPDSL